MYPCRSNLILAGLWNRINSLNQFHLLLLSIMSSSRIGFRNGPTISLGVIRFLMTFTWIIQNPISRGRLPLKSIEGYLPASLFFSSSYWFSFCSHFTQTCFSSILSFGILTIADVPRWAWTMDGVRDIHQPRAAREMWHTKQPLNFIGTKNWSTRDEAGTRRNQRGEMHSHGGRKTHGKVTMVCNCEDWSWILWIEIELWDGLIYGLIYQV